MGFPRIFTACGRSAPLPFPSQPPWHGLLLLRASVISSPVEGASAGLRFTWKRTRIRSTSGTWNSMRTTTYSSFPDQGKRLFQVCLHEQASYDRNRTETLESERATRKPEHCTLLSNSALCQRMHGEPSQIRAYSRDDAPAEVDVFTESPVQESARRFQPGSAGPMTLRSGPIRCRRRRRRAGPRRR